MKRLYALTALLFLGGIGFIGYSFFGGGLPGPKKPKTFNDDARVNEILEKDWNRLENSEGVAEHHAFGGIVRLAKLRSDKNTLSLVLKYKDNSSAKIRSGVAIALGNFEDDIAEEELILLLNDEDDQVKLEAIKALAEKPSRLKREALVQLMMKGKNLTEDQKVALFSSILRTTRDGEMKDKMVNRLLTIMDSESKSAVEAAIQVSQLAPKNDSTREAFKKAIEARKPIGVAQRGIYYLASMRSPWLKEGISSLLRDDDEIIRTAAVQSLSQLCPDDRYELVKKIFKTEKSENVLNIAAQTTLFMIDEKMLQTIRSLGSESLPDRSQKPYNFLLENLNSSNTRDICQLQN